MWQGWGSHLLSLWSLLCWMAFVLEEVSCIKKKQITTLHVLPWGLVIDQTSTCWINTRDFRVLQSMTKVSLRGGFPRFL